MASNTLLVVAFIALLSVAVVNGAGLEFDPTNAQYLYSIGRPYEGVAFQSPMDITTNSVGDWVFFDGIANRVIVLDHTNLTKIQLLFGYNGLTQPGVFGNARALTIGKGGVDNDFFIVADSIRIQIFNALGVYQRELNTYQIASERENINTDNSRFKSNSIDILPDSGLFYSNGPVLAIVDLSQDETESYLEIYNYHGATNDAPIVRRTHTELGLSVPILCAKFDGYGNIWVLTTLALHRFPLQSSGVISLTSDMTIALQLNTDNPSMFTIHPTNRNMYYATSASGIRTFTYSSGSFTPGTVSPGSAYISSPRAVALLPTGYVVASLGSSSLFVFSLTYFSQQIRGQPAGDGQFSTIQGVCIHKASGTVVVADATNNNLQVFTKTGTWLNAYSNPSYFNNPVHCSFDGDHIYVDMQAISYVYRWDFSLSGNIAHFDNAIYYKVKQSSNGAAMCNGLLVVSSSAKPTAYISSYRSTSIGTAVDTPLNQIALSVSSQPYGITCDNTYIYAANAGGGIIRLTMNPTTGAFTIVNDAYAVSLSNPYGVAVDSDFLYATESTRQKMSIFAVTPGSPTPRLHDFGTPGTGPSYFARPYHLALHQNYMFIVNNGNARVDVFCTQLAPEVKTSLFVLFVGEPFEEVVLDVTGSFQRYFINAIGTWPEGVTADYTTNLVVNDTVSLMGNATTAGKYQFHIGISDPNNCSSAPVLLNVTILEAPGVITNYSPKNITTEGNVLVTLTGRYPNADLLAIMPDLVVTAFIGDKPCTGLIFLSDTQATCTVAAGYGDLNVIKMNYFSAVPAFNKDISYKYFAYGAPVIDTVDMGDSIVTAGGIAITLHGAFFGAIGAPVEIRIAGLLCTAPQTNVAHTEVTCIAPIGVGDKSLVNITVGDSTYGKLSGTKRVVYEQVNFGCSQLQVSAGPSTDGGHLLSICGANFGESELNVTSAAGTWTGTRTVMVRDKVCRIEYIDNDLVVCRLPPGTGAYNSVKINFNHINWIKTGINVAYAAPQITEVSPPESLKTGSTLTVFGYNFGFNTPDAPRSITIGTDATCENIVLIGNDMLTCVVNGGRGSNQPLVLWVDGQTHSNSYTVDYILQSTTGLACLPPTGAQDPLSNDHTICNCYSGYQPADEANTQCVPPQDKKRSTNLETCPGKVLKLHQEGQFPPHRPIVRFHNDRVYIEQKSSVVHGRRESYLYFMSPNMTTFDPNRKNRRSEFTCEFPGHLWTKTVDSLDCNDVWSGQIPWSQHDMCGWDMISLPTSHIIEYATELNHQYRDVIKAPGVYHQSVHRVSYLLKVTFKRELQVVSGAFSVFFPEVESSPIDVVITSALLYDPALEHIVFTFRTTMNYPYMINPGTTLNGVYAPDATAATLYAVYNDAGDAECDPLQPHTDCEQEWHAVLEVAAGTCLLDGQLIFNTSTLLCRDSEGPAACPTTGFYQTSFILTADNIRVCDTTELDATEDTTIAISSYADAAFSTPNNAFQVGDFVYFRVVINSADATIDKIILTNVVIAPNRPNEEVVLDGTGVQVDASFTYTNVTQANSPVWPIAPGKNTGVAFSFRLTRSGLNSISSINGGDSYAELEIQATVDITYHGNSKKRSMTASSNSFESLTESAHLRVASINYDEEEVEAIVEQAVETEDDAFGAFWANDAANYKQTTTTVLFGVLLAAFMLAL